MKHIIELNSDEQKHIIMALENYVYDEILWKDEFDLIKFLKEFDSRLIEVREIENMDNLIFTYEDYGSDLAIAVKKIVEVVKPSLSKEEYLKVEKNLDAISNAIYQLEKEINNNIIRLNERLRNVELVVDDLEE